jgi:anti-sigma B factor antagonist
MKVEKIEGITILATDERLDNFDGPKLEEAVKELAQESGLRLVLDIAKTGFIDSTGLHTLLSLRKIMTMNQGDIKIARPTPQAFKVFQLTKLDRVFEIHDSVESAVVSFT